MRGDVLGRLIDRAAREKGRGGWQTCPPEELSRMLREHVEAGAEVTVVEFLDRLSEPVHQGMLADAPPVMRAVEVDAGQLGEKHASRPLVHGAELATEHVDELHVTGQTVGVSEVEGVQQVAGN